MAIRYKINVLAELKEKGYKIENICYKVSDID